MTPAERKALAEQLLGNPLFNEILCKMEKDAAERCFAIHATDEQRAEAAFYVRCARSFRRDCEASARNTPERKGAPA